jgi:hypothetical protein
MKADIITSTRILYYHKSGIEKFKRTIPYCKALSLCTLIDHFWQEWWGKQKKVIWNFQIIYWAWDKYKTEDHISIQISYTHDGINQSDRFVFAKTKDLPKIIE